MKKENYEKNNSKRTNEQRKAKDRKRKEKKRKKTEPPERRPLWREIDSASVRQHAEGIRAMAGPCRGQPGMGWEGCRSYQSEGE
jgi:hypothetical protein